MIKGSIQEDATFINIYAFNIGTPKYIKQILTDKRGEIDSNTIIVGDFNTSLTSMDGPSRQKIIKERLVLSDTSDQMELIEVNIEHSTPKQQNTHCFRCPVTSPG